MCWLFYSTYLETVWKVLNSVTFQIQGLLTESHLKTITQRATEWKQCQESAGVGPAFTSAWLSFPEGGKRDWEKVTLQNVGNWGLTDWLNAEQEGWGILRTNRVQWEENFLFLWTPGWSLATCCSALKKAWKQWNGASKLPPTHAVSSCTQCSRRMRWRQFIKTNWDSGAADIAQKRRAWTTLAGDQVQFPTPTSSHSQRHTTLAPGDPMPSSPTQLSPAYLIKTTSLKEKEETHTHTTSLAFSP